MKRPLSSQCLLKYSQVRPKTAEAYSFKKIAAILEKKYRAFQNRGNHSSSSKGIQEGRKKRYYVEKIKPKNTSQRQLQYGTLFKVKTFEGLIRSPAINKQTNSNLSLNPNVQRERSDNTTTSQKFDFQLLNFCQEKRIITSAQGRTLNENRQLQGTTELIKRFLNLRQGAACKSSPVFLAKKPESLSFDESNQFIPYTHQSQQQKISNNQTKLDERLSKIIERQAQIQNERLKLFSKPEKVNEKIQIKASAKRFLNEHGKKLQKRGKVSNFTSKNIKDKADKQNTPNIPQFFKKVNIKQTKLQSKEQSFKQFIIDEWEQTDEFRNPSESFTSLFQAEL